MRTARSHRTHRDIAVITTDLEGMITVFNPVAERILGYSAQEVIGRSIPIQDFHALNKNKEHYFHHPLDAEYTRSDGHSIELETTLSPIQDASGKPTGLLFTAQHTPEEDSDFRLSDLPDNTVFEIVLKREISRLQRDAQSLALIKIDVDHFTSYREHYGEADAQKLLTEIGCTLNARIQRASDLLVYAGFDEFWVLLPNTEISGAVKLAELLRLKILDLEWPTKVSTNAEVVTISLGITHLFPYRDVKIKDILHLADNALQLAKKQGRNCTRFELGNETND